MLLPLATLAQSAAAVSGIAFSQFGTPIAFAKVRVCLISATGAPCSPTATIYQDYLLTHAIANPTTADAFGNFTFYVGTGSPNYYTVQISPDGGTTYPTSFVYDGPGAGGGGGTPGGSTGSVQYNNSGVFGGVSVTGVLAGNGSSAPGLATSPQMVTALNTSPSTTLSPSLLPLATTGAFGAVKPDGTTIGVTGGVISVIGGGGGGVSSINSTTGAFLFTGSVSCTGSGPATCNFSGTGGGAITPSTATQIPVFTGSTTVAGDSFLTDTAPTNGTTGLLTYTGPGGINASSTFGANYVFSTSTVNSSSTAFQGGITLQSTVNAATGATTPGLVSISTTDNGGNNFGSNVDISATENSASGGANAGIINLSTSTQSSGGGSIILSTSSGASTGTPLGANIELITANPGGATPNTGLASISINAASGTGFFSVTSSNFNVGTNGNVQADGTVSATNFQATGLTVGQCVSVGAGGTFTTVTCGSGGGSIGGSGTIGFIPTFTATNAIGNSHMDDGATTAGLITSTEDISVNDGTGVGGGFTGYFGSQPTSVASATTVWGDLTSSRLKMNNASNGALFFVGLSTAGTSGHCAEFGTNGIDLIDFGAACASGGMTGTPSVTVDSGAGTGASASIVSGSTDGSGWVSVTTGTSPLGGNVGLVTIVYGGTYATIPRCGFSAANLNAAPLSGATQVFISSGANSTTGHFVFSTGSSALAASTTYVWRWGCSL